MGGFLENCTQLLLAPNFMIAFSSEEVERQKLFLALNFFSRKISQKCRCREQELSAIVKYWKAWPIFVDSCPVLFWSDIWAIWKSDRVRRTIVKYKRNLFTGINWSALVKCIVDIVSSVFTCECIKLMSNGKQHKGKKLNNLDYYVIEWSC